MRRKASAQRDQLPKQHPTAFNWIPLITLTMDEDDDDLYDPADSFPAQQETNGHAQHEGNVNAEEPYELEEEEEEEEDDASFLKEKSRLTATHN